LPNQPPDQPIINAMSVDVEDYFQVSAFERHVPRERWDAIPSRVEVSTARVLDLFAEHQVRATFFTLGWVAERFPALVRRIHEEGHEVASHGHSHVRLTDQTAEQFRREAADTRKLLEDTAGCAVRGFRAASFSIDRRNLWALDVIAETGHAYSSSIYPVRHDHYGLPDAPRFPFRCAGGALLEVPVTTVSFLGRTLPAGGGGYFRLLPYRYFRWATRRVNEGEGRPTVFFLHPWEVDPGQPRQPGLDPKTRFRHYVNLSRMLPRLARLARDFSWGRMDRVFLDDASLVTDELDLAALPAA
jgi:polysaccharide deacetylase family protein (PEP-CTERM system associated)